VPIHGRPLLDYWLDLTFAAGVERALVNLHYFPDAVRAHVAASPWRDRIDLTFEETLLGTGGSLVANRAYFDGAPFIAAHADNLTDVDLRALMEAHARRPRSCALTMLAFRTDDPRSCGILERDARNVVRKFHEKVENPPGNLANAAVYIVEPEIVDFAARLSKPFVDLSTEVLPHFERRIFAVEHYGYHRDIGNPDALRKAHAEFSPPRQS
jgi:mannose-1-phosphate guanylyltransferase